MHACINGHTETAVALAELGADKDIKNNVNMTPLFERTHPYSHFAIGHTPEGSFRRWDPPATLFHEGAFFSTLVGTLSEKDTPTPQKYP